MVRLGDNSKMRGDVPLYIVAIICFASAIGLYTTMQVEVSAYILTLAVLGVIFLGAGYSLRPKPATTETERVTVSTPATTTFQEVTAPTAPVAEETITITETKTSLELTDVKGIGPKRAEQLKKAGIQTVEELAKESSTDLSKKMNISPKIAEKWIAAAKKALED